MVCSWKIYLFYGTPLLPTTAASPPCCLCQWQAERGFLSTASHIPSACVEGGGGGGVCVDRGVSPAWLIQIQRPA